MRGKGLIATSYAKLKRSPFRRRHCRTSSTRFVIPSQKETNVHRHSQKIASLVYPKAFPQAKDFGLTSYPYIRVLTGRTFTRETKEQLELLQGTLDLLILRTLILGLQHGQGIARDIQQNSDEELLVEHGALYPGLQRLEDRGWISAKRGISTHNRKARFYSLTSAGRRGW